jgi:hypothetical protein
MKTWWSLVPVLVVFAFCRSAQTAEKPETAATKEALAWLAMVDQGKNGESWDGAAKFFKGAVTREKWIDAVTAARGPFGKVVSRKVKSAKFMTTLPGAPEGKYVVIQFATAFEQKKKAVETITPMQEPDGSWKVSGYFIK